MDFGIGFLSNNVMIPILDLFYGIVPSYGLAIVALTLVIRFALYPLSAGSIRNMRRMRVAQPVMQKRVKEVQERYKDDPARQQAEMSELYKEFGNPLAGCLPVLVQMPVLFAPFATLRGSPFSDINYSLEVEIFPQEQIERVQPQVFASAAQNIYLSDNVHAKVTALLPAGNRLIVGDKTSVDFQTLEGQPLLNTVEKYGTASELRPEWKVTSGSERLTITEDGKIEALQPGKATIEGTIHGLASDKGFLFIEALGRVGARSEDGVIHWDIVAMVLTFGITLYVNQLLSDQGKTANANPQQETIGKVTPIIFSGMFLFFPLPAGVLMYMTIANIFQTLQTFILSREPLPENLQKIVDAQAKEAGEDNRDALPFEHKKSKKSKAS